MPALLDEVHWLIENRGLSFALCGSSARKVKHGAANLLGGRALRLELHGLTALELGAEFDLDRVSTEAICRGSTRPPTLSGSWMRTSRAFLDVAALSDGEIVNFSNVALTAFRSYREFDGDLSYWRLAGGNEVDFVLGDMRLAVEAKSSEGITWDHLKGLRSLAEDHPGVGRRVVVCREPRPRVTDDKIEILPVATFVAPLWGRELG